MRTYTHRVRESILPKSIGDTFPAAFAEWFFTEEVVDHEQPIETCELCGQERLRYHFEIANEFNQNSMWVDFHCILQIDLAVYDEGRRLSHTEAKRKLDKLAEQMRQASCIRALDKPGKTESK